MPILIEATGFYTVKELAIILNKSVQTIRRYINSGKLKSVGLVGTAHMIQGAEVIKYLKKGKPASTVRDKFKKKGGNKWTKNKELGTWKD